MPVDSRSRGRRGVPYGRIAGVYVLGGGNRDSAGIGDAGRWGDRVRRGLELESLRARALCTARIMNGAYVDPELLELANYGEWEMPKRPGWLWRLFFERKGISI